VSYCVNGFCVDSCHNRASFVLVVVVALSPVASGAFVGLAHANEVPSPPKLKYEAL